MPIEYNITGLRNAAAVSLKISMDSSSRACSISLTIGTFLIVIDRPSHVSAKSIDSGKSRALTAICKPAQKGRGPQTSFAMTKSRAPISPKDGVGGAPVSSKVLFP